MEQKKSPSFALVFMAFAAVYITWGSTYFFIERAVKLIPPMLLGGLRFLTAGTIMLIWVMSRGEKIWNKQAIIHSAISGTMMLFIGNGAVIWSEQYLSSSFVAIFLASGPIWFLVFDKINWKVNFKNKFTLIGIITGLVGVVALFYEKIGNTHQKNFFVPLLVIFIGNIGWVSGSLYSKYKIKNFSSSVSSAWQIFAAGIVFFIFGFINHSIQEVRWNTITVDAWLSLGYLIIFGSIIGYTAYVFLMNVRNPAQVSSYAYVNPLVAVILGVFINHDHLTPLQFLGLFIILGSVLFINIAKKLYEGKAGIKPRLAKLLFKKL